MKALCVLILSASLMAGCAVQSLHPFASEKAAVHPEGIDGDWVYVGESEKDALAEHPEILRFDTAANRIDFIGKNAEESDSLKSLFFRVDGVLFLQTTIPDNKNGIAGPMRDAHLRPVYCLVAMQLTDNTLGIIYPDPATIAALADKQPGKLPGVDSRDMPRLFTATTAQWQAFLKVHARNEELFGAKASPAHHIRKAEYDRRRAEKLKAATPATPAPPPAGK